jgi:hypothetical protein
MLELYVLICIIIGLIALIQYNSKENFDNPNLQNSQSYLTSCPSGYNSFYDKDGSTMCCSGEIVANMCSNNIQCTLTGSGAISNCTQFIAKDYVAKAKDVCPASMPNYYENRGKQIKGCTSGKLNQTMDGLATTSQPSCKIYDTPEHDMQALDSCFNQKEMDAFPCFGQNCKKTMTQNTVGTPVQITVSFSDDKGIPRSGITRASMKRFLDATMPNWKDKMSLETNIAVAEVAKGVYIDKTMQAKDVTH